MNQLGSVDLAALADTVGPLLVEWGLNALGAVALFLVGRWLAVRLRNATRRALERARVDEMLRPFLARVVYWLTLAVVVVAVLNLFGVQTASVVAILGAAGLAVGLAFQGALSNLAAGVMLLIFRPFQKGELVEVGGTKGRVVETGLFTTALDTPENLRVLVPNGQIFGETLTNYSTNPVRRVDMVVGVDYGDDLDTAEETLRRILAEHPTVLDAPEPVVAVAELGASSVDFVVRPWCETGEHLRLRWELTRLIKDEIEGAGCSFPYPQRDVHLHREDAA